MRKVLIALLLLVAGFAFGQVKIEATDIVLEWDAVTTYEDLSPLLPGDVIEYEVWGSLYPVGNHLIPEDFLTLTDLTTFATTVPEWSGYAYAIRSKLTTDGGTTILYSAWVWSDVEGEPVPFFLALPPTTVAPADPLHLHLQ